MKIATIKSNLESFVLTMETAQQSEQIKIALYTDKLRSQELSATERDHCEKELKRFEKRLLLVSKMYSELSESEIAELRKSGLSYDAMLSVFNDSKASTKLGQMLKALAHRSSAYLKDNKIDKFLSLVASSEDSFVSRSQYEASATNLRESTCSPRQSQMCRKMLARLSVITDVCEGNRIVGFEIDKSSKAYALLAEVFAS